LSSRHTWRLILVSHPGEIVTSGWGINR
jgi:hypothetical protein